MNFDNIEEILSSISVENRKMDGLSSFRAAIDEIKHSSETEPDSYDSHLMLREKYFHLVRSLIEMNNEVLAKLIFSALQKYCSDESKCDKCSLKEKSQFILNILRYIQHTDINSDLIRLEIFKFFLNNYEPIERLLNAKILTSVIEICTNEFENNENKFVKSSSKALIIKYIALLCNHISLHKTATNADSDKDLLDSFIAVIFGDLVCIFNKEEKSNELRCLILECLELLLNNLLIEQQNEENKCSYRIRNNRLFVEFAWQHFCPCILFQFGDCGLLNNANRYQQTAPQSIHFKQIYTILIQLTGLLGSCDEMIQVFEAIYQRLLLYPPEQDRHILLKLFKTYVNRHFVLTLCEKNALQHETENQVAKTCESKMEPAKEINGFTLLNLIVAFYRNCYEKSMQSNDKIIQLLSCECISSFVQTISELFETSSSKIEHFEPKCDLKFDKSHEKYLSMKEYDEKMDSNIRDEALDFVQKLDAWFTSILRIKDDEKSQKSENLDNKIIRFCLELAESNSSRKIIKSNPYMIYSSVHLSIYFLIKLDPNSCRKFGLSESVFWQDLSAAKRYFVHRVLVYESADFSNNSISHSDANKSKSHSVKFLSVLFDLLMEYRQANSNKTQALERFGAEIRSALKQIDSFTLTKLVHKNVDQKCNTHTCLVKKLLKNSWTYLIDVLVGFLLNTDLNCIGELLCGDESKKAQDFLNNTDFSLTIFALKSCLESLGQLVQIMTSLSNMENELNQLYFLLNEANLNRNTAQITLNRVLCIDFVLFTTSKILLFEKNESQMFGENILWKYFVGSMFFCLYLRASNSSIRFEEKDGDANKLDSFNGINIFKILLKSQKELLKNDASSNRLSSPKNIFQSIHFNSLRESITLNRATASLPSSAQNQESFDHEASCNESLEANSRNEEFDSIKYQLIYQCLFKFLSLNHSNYETFDIIGQFSQSIDEILFKKQSLNNIESFDFAFNAKFCSTLCSFSKQCLIDDPMLRLKKDYFTFNVLILDKIEEILIDLLGKCLEQNHAFVFNDLWMNIFVPFFRKLFSKYSSKLHRVKRIKKMCKITQSNANNQDQVKASLQFILNSSKKLLNNSNDSTSPNLNNPDTNEENVAQLDLIIIKKLICLVQKLFEIYNRHHYEIALKPLEIYHATMSTQKEYDSLLANHRSKLDEVFRNFDDKETQLIDKLDLWRTFLNSTSDLNKNADLLSFNLFYSSTKSVNLPKNSSPIEAKQILRQSSTNQYFNIHIDQILLLPFNFLALNKRMDSTLKSLIIFSLCEMIECNSMYIRSAWSCIFNIINKLEINFEQNHTEKPNKSFKNETSTKQKYNLSSAESTSSSSSLNESVYESDSSTDSVDSDESNSSCEKEKGFELANASFRFDLERARLNSLLNIFNIYLSLAENFDQVLTSGAMGFIKCIARYLQHKISVDIERLLLFDEQREDKMIEVVSCEAEPKWEENEDELLFLSPNDYLMQEKHYSFVSNYEHLVELGEENDSNSSARPFLALIQKFFKILIKSQSSKFQFSEHESQPVCFELDSLRPFRPITVDCLSNSHFKYYDLDEFFERELSGTERGENILQNMESNEEFSKLNEKLRRILNRQNTMKLMVHLVKSLSLRIFTSIDEITCVQIVELIYNIMHQLIDEKMHELSSYLLLQVLMKDLNMFLDLIESELQRQESKTLLNKKLLSNKFFVHNLVSTILKKITNLVQKLFVALSPDPLDFSCVLSRLNYLLVKSTVTCLSKFNSILDIDFLSELDSLYKKIFASENLNLKKKCLDTFNLIQLLSLVPFHTLIKQYELSKSRDYEPSSKCASEDERSSIVSSDSANKKDPNNNQEIIGALSCLEVLAEKCKNVWELHLIKKSFNNARGLFYHHQLENSAKSDANYVCDSLSDYICHSDFINSQEEVQSSSHSTNNDDRNFFRDFTIRFNRRPSTSLEKDSSSSNSKTLSNIFLQDEAESVFTDEHIQAKQVNIACFISAYKLHMNLIKMIKNYVLSEQEISNKNQVLFYEFMRLLNRSYLTSVRIDRVLELKILLSKIFNLNLNENFCMVNFLLMTTESFLLIDYFYTSLLFSNPCFRMQNTVKKLDLASDSYDSLKDLNKSEKSSELESKMWRLFSSHNSSSMNSNFAEHFALFFRHLSQNYLAMYETCHRNKFERKLLANLMHKNGTVSREEVTALFNKCKEQSKTLTMISLTQKAETMIHNFLDNESNSQTEGQYEGPNYFEKDLLHRLQIWSNRMINCLVLSFSSTRLSTNELNFEHVAQFYRHYDKQDHMTLIGNLADLIVVLNSCSTYCQCLSIDLEQQNANTCLSNKNIREISTSLLANVLNYSKNYI